MANSNIQSYPLLPANARQLQADDVILVLRNGFPYRYMVSPGGSTDTLDLVVSSQQDPQDSTRTQQIVTLPTNANEYTWVELAIRIPGRGASLVNRRFVFPLEDVDSGGTLLADESSPGADDAAFMSGSSTVLTINGASSVTTARLRRPTSTL